LGVQWYNGGIKAADGESISIDLGYSFIGGGLALDPKTGNSCGCFFCAIGNATRIPLLATLGYDKTKKFSIREDLVPAIQNLFGGGSAAGGFLIYPNKPNNNMMTQVYHK